MASTNAHKELWSRLAKRFGAEWYEKRGQNPNDEWTKLFDRYTPAQIDAALEAMAKREWYGVPNHPQMASLLESAALRNPVADSGIDHVRAYWRSAVLTDIERTGPLLDLWRYGNFLTDTDEQLRARIMREAKILIDRLCQMEAEGASRTSQVSEAMTKHVWRMLEGIKVSMRIGGKPS